MTCAARGPERRLPPKPPFPYRGLVAAAVVVAILVWSVLPQGLGAGLLVWRDDQNHAAGVAVPSLIEVARLSGIFFRQLFPSTGHPWPLSALPEIRDRMWETLRIAFAASIFGSVAALFYAMVGARNLAATRWVYGVGRALLNLIRTVPDLVLAAILAVMLGIGPLPGLVALSVASFGVIAKLLCDTVETLDPGPIEAITAAGGTRLQRALFAVFPQVAPDYLSYTLYAFEYNVRAATVLGLVGAGGIGMLIDRNIAFMDYLRLGEIIAVTFVAVLLIDSLSTFLRSRLI
jgi:phosphonate transport system permease protein